MKDDTHESKRESPWRFKQKVKREKEKRRKESMIEEENYYKQTDKKIDIQADKHR